MPIGGIEEGFAHDAALLIPFDDLRKRLVYWEEFLKRYPLFPLRSDIEDNVVVWLQFYISGIDNSPIYESLDIPNERGGRVLKEVRNSYHNFATVNQESRYCPIVREWLFTLRDNDFIVTDRMIEDFVASRLVGRAW